MVNLVVENGTGLDNANAYVGIDQARHFALENDMEFPEDDDELAILLIRATNFFDSFENSFVGTRLSPTQQLAFPRASDCNRLHLYDMRNLQKALMYAVEVLATGESLVPKKLEKEDYVKKEKLDVLEVQYDSDYFKSLGSVDLLSKYPMIYNYMRGYIRSMGYSVKVGR